MDMDSGIDMNADITMDTDRHMNMVRDTGYGHDMVQLSQRIIIRQSGAISKSKLQEHHLCSE
jgi:hypothetical protein